MPKTKKKGKSKAVDEDEGKYQVEVILAARVAETDSGNLGWSGPKEYYVKWAYYDDDSNTWEPDTNLESCNRLLDSFWKHIGLDNKDYHLGFEVYAKEEWIKGEKKYFALENDEEQKKLREKRAKEERERLRKFRESKGASADAPSVGSSGSKWPTATTSATAKTTTKKSKKKKSSVPDSESDSDRDNGLYPKQLKKRKRKESTAPLDDAVSSGATRVPPQKAQKVDGGRKVSTDNAQPQKEKKTMENLFSDSESESSPEMPLKALAPESPTKAPVLKQKAKDTVPRKTPSATASPQIQIPQSAVKPKPLLPLPQRRPSAPSITSPLATPSGTPNIPHSTTPRIPSQSNTPNIPTKSTSVPQLPKRSMLASKSSTATIATSAAASPQIASASRPGGISTKSKIQQEALQLVQPGQQKKPVRPALSLKTSSATTTAIPTGFKKRPEYPPAQPSAEFQRPTPSSAAPPTRTVTEPVLSPNMVVESPVDMSNVMLGPPADDDNMMLDNNMDHMTPGWSPAPFTFTPVAKTVLEQQTDDFLKSIMPEALAAPLEPHPEEQEQRDILPPGSLMSRKSTVIPKQRIPKKWTWAGKVFTDNSPSTPIFNVKFDNVSDHVDKGLRFSIVLAGMDHIRFPTFHDTNDFGQIIRACKKPTQYAGLNPAGDGDHEPMRVFSQYLRRFRKIVVAPAYLDGHFVAVMLVLPCVEAFYSKISVPVTVTSSQPQLVVALMPWIASTSHLSHRWRRELTSCLPSNISIPAKELYPKQWSMLLKKDPLLHRALRILKPTNNFLQYVGGHQRKYYIWHGDADGTSKRSGLETHMLRAILKHCSAEPVNDPSHARLVFIHVGALSRLHMFPNFAMLCAMKSSIQFHTYGTHASVSPESWGMKEIYPCGGVVTFTPGAIINDYFGVMDRIRQIYAHPLWLCYVLPVVLGFAARSFGDNPLEQYDMDIAPYTQLLMAIANGEVALLSSPPISHSPTRERGDPRLDWIVTHFIDRPEDPRSILEFCIDAFDKKYGHLERSKAASAILNEISRDLSSIRQQPAMMDKYRRYNVLREEKEKVYRDGNDWTTATNFDFRDDFFPKQT